MLAQMMHFIKSYYFRGPALFTGGQQDFNARYNFEGRNQPVTETTDPMPPSM